MNYHLRSKAGAQIVGPFELRVIRRKLDTGEITKDWQATGDIGETPDQLKKLRPRDWMQVEDIPRLFAAEPDVSTNAPGHSAHACREPLGSECPRCLSRRMVPGQLSEEQRSMRGVAFRPAGTRFWKMWLFAGLLLEDGYQYACLDCGLVFGEVNPAELRQWIEQRCDAETRKAISRRG